MPFIWSLSRKQQQDPEANASVVKQI